ncbi:hypothetical protein B0H16DRAFT_1452855 [Mycena metata]|uniref:Uncharacterized protein n=1 Tax=Mycena metata TaxID=1033252 RepID=A0AAD7NPH5_9AGAR|nr:hypothetical protein B0H16DRAFT_1452855 [Mycena metata]
MWTDIPDLFQHNSTLTIEFYTRRHQRKDYQYVGRENGAPVLDESKCGLGMDFKADTGSRRQVIVSRSLELRGDEYAPNLRNTDVHHVNLTPARVKTMRKVNAHTLKLEGTSLFVVPRESEFLTRRCSRMKMSATTGQNECKGKKDGDIQSAPGCFEMRVRVLLGENRQNGVFGRGTVTERVIWGQRRLEARSKREAVKSRDEGRRVVAERETRDVTRDGSHRNINKHQQLRERNEPQIGPTQHKSL